MISKKRIVEDYDYFWAHVWDSSDDWVEGGEGSLRMLALRSLPSDPGRVLDLGCGNGIALSVLAKKRPAAIGCDISLRALKDAQLHGEVARADGTCLPFRSKSFRFILMLDALEHVVEKTLLVKECWRVLDEDGIMVLTTPQPGATGGLGDRRQPYDRPVTYTEIASMIKGLFRLQSAKGVFHIRRLRGLSRLLKRIPNQLFVRFPILLNKASEIMLVLEKESDPR